MTWRAGIPNERGAARMAEMPSRFFGCVNGRWNRILVLRTAPNLPSRRRLTGGVADLVHHSLSGIQQYNLIPVIVERHLTGGQIDLQFCARFNLSSECHGVAGLVTQPPAVQVHGLGAIVLEQNPFLALMLTFEIGKPGCDVRANPRGKGRQAPSSSCSMHAH